MKDAGACAVRQDHADLRQTSRAKTDHAECYVEDTRLHMNTVIHEYHGDPWTGTENGACL